MGRNVLKKDQKAGEESDDKKRIPNEKKQEWSERIASRSIGFRFKYRIFV
jgi:hypothetical protein